MSMLIGITGGIGAGKSVVSRMVRLNGGHVYDCDYEARRLMEDETCGVPQALRELCGGGVYHPDGSLDRAAMAALIFGDGEMRRRVNAVVHGAVRADMTARRAALERRGVGVMWVESAIMATSGLAPLCDQIWLVDAPDEVRVARAVVRGAREDDVRRRLMAQRSETEALERCGVPVARISNRGGEDLTTQIEKIESINNIKI